MSALVWTAFGMTIGAAVLHATLGLRQPRDPTYLSFAWGMAGVAGFMYFAHELYTSTGADDAIEAMRRREIMTHAIIACLLVFLPAYARMRAPRVVTVLLWAGLAAAVITNIVTPYGILYATKPTLTHETFRGAPYATLIASPFAFRQYAYSIYQLALFAFAISFAVRMIRHSDRRRGAILAVAAVLVSGGGFLDAFRQATGRSWPFVAEYAFVGWGVIMAVQLAIDYRAQAVKLAEAITNAGAQASRLTAILGAMRGLEHNIDAPLQTLETGICQLDGVTPDAELARLRRAVTRLRALSDAMPNLRTRPRKRN